MTNNSDLLAHHITLDELIAYAAMNYIPSPTTPDDIAQLDTIDPEMRDTTDAILLDILPMTLLDDLDDADLDAAATIIESFTRSDAFYSRILDIALARLIN